MGRAAAVRSSSRGIGRIGNSLCSVGGARSIAFIHDEPGSAERFRPTQLGRDAERRSVSAKECPEKNGAPRVSPLCPERRAVPCSTARPGRRRFECRLSFSADSRQCLRAQLGGVRRVARAKRTSPAVVTNLWAGDKPRRDSRVPQGLLVLAGSPSEAYISGGRRHEGNRLPWDRHC